MKPMSEPPRRREPPPPGSASLRSTVLWKVGFSVLFAVVIFAGLFTNDPSGGARIVAAATLAFGLLGLAALIGLRLLARRRRD